MFIKVTSILIIFLLNACNSPKPGEGYSDLTDVPTPELGADSQTPQDFKDTDCGYVSAREEFPDLSKEFKFALREVHPEAKGYAEA